MSSNTLFFFSHSIEYQKKNVYSNLQVWISGKECWLCFDNYDSPSNECWLWFGNSNVKNNDVDFDLAILAFQVTNVSSYAKFGLNLNLQCIQLLFCKRMQVWACQSDYWMWCEYLASFAKLSATSQITRCDVNLYSLILAQNFDKLLSGVYSQSKLFQWKSSTK